jgi:hypothetical protein
MKRVLLVLAVVGSGLAGAAAPAAEPVARGAAMGGAYPTLAGGVEGLWYNPAMLGSPILGSVGLGLTLQGGNNALTISEFQGILNDDASAKADAVQKIRDAGKWEARIEMAGGAGFTLMGFAIGITPRILVEALNVSPELAQNWLTPGNLAWLAPNVSHHITGEVKRSVYNEISVGYAHDLGGLIPGISLAAGGALKYLQGTDYERFWTNWDIPVLFTGLPLVAGVHERASKGTGYGADLGLQAGVLGILKAAVVVKNIGTSIKWDGTVESADSALSGTNTRSTTGKGNITQKVPTQVQVGASGSIPVVGTSLAAALDVRTNPTETRLRLGAEQSLGLLAFRLGYVTASGPETGMVTFGLGVGALVASLDLSAGIAAGGKGGMASASAKVSF